MLEYLERRFALSHKGAEDTVTGSICSALQNLSFMSGVSILFLLIRNLLRGRTTGDDLLLYIAGSLLSCTLIVVTTHFQYTTTYLRTYTESGKRRIMTAEKLRKLPLSFFSKKDLSELTASIMNDAAVLEKSQSHYICPLIGAMLSTLITLICLFVFSVPLAAAAFWPVPLSFLVILSAGSVQVRLSKKNMEAKEECEDSIQEMLEAMTDLKTNNAEYDYTAKLKEKIGNVERRSLITEFGTAAFVVSSALILKLGTASIVLAGSLLLVSGKVDMLTFIFFLIMATRLYDPLETALQNLAAIISTKSNIERMNGILDTQVQTGEERLSNNGTDIVFENVGFSYDNSTDVIRDISFTAKEGEVTALVGPSGSGKTTISRLCCRFWDITKGKITVGGMDISKVDPETLLQLYSIVFQDVTLFNNTIMENIRIGRRDATDEEVIRAAEKAGVDEFALRSSDGYNMMIGENGEKLSGGERQRISIARAFLKDAPILLLDEATASLDVDNETRIQKALSDLVKDRTVLIIAHRMRTISGADRILVLKDGVIAEEGTGEELIEKNGIFARMAGSQTESGKWRL